MSDLFDDPFDAPEEEQESELKPHQKLRLLQDFLIRGEELYRNVVTDDIKSLFLETWEVFKELAEDSDLMKLHAVELGADIKADVLRMREIEFFRSTPEEDIVHLLDSAEGVNLEQGKPVYNQYEEFDYVYLLPEKAIVSDLNRYVPDTKRNGIFGALACINGDARAPYTVTPISNCSAFRIHRDRFVQAIKEIPGLYESLLYRLVKSLTLSLLESKSEKTNAQEQQRLTKEILEHMGVGSFSINQAGEIGENYSDLAKIYLGRENLVGLPFADIVLGEDKDALRNFYRALQLLFSGNKIDPEVIINLLPKESNVNNRVLSFDYSFVQDVYGNVLSVFVRMKDLTKERDLGLKERQDRKIQDAMRSNIGGYFLMLKDIKNTLDQLILFNGKHIKGNAKPDSELVEKILNAMHSSKGLSGQFELNTLKTIIHDMEGQVQTIDKGDFNTEGFEALLKEFKKEYRYAASFKDALGENIVRVLQGVSFSQAEFRMLKDSANSGDLATIKSLIFEKTLSSASKIVENWDKDISKLAREENKKINFHAEIPKELQIPSSIAHLLNVELGHLYRNSIHHGIELPKERISLGKEEIGNINVKVEKDGDIVQIELRDDGAGLDSEKIAEMAKKNPNLDQEKIQQFIQTEDFWKILTLPGFSSSQSVTKIAGRGVGMGAVEEALKSIDGSIEMSGSKNLGCKFEIKIKIASSE